MDYIKIVEQIELECIALKKSIEDKQNLITKSYHCMKCNRVSKTLGLYERHLKRCDGLLLDYDYISLKNEIENDKIGYKEKKNNLKQFDKTEKLCQKCSKICKTITYFKNHKCIDYVSHNCDICRLRFDSELKYKIHCDEGHYCRMWRKKNGIDVQCGKVFYTVTHRVQHSHSNSKYVWSKDKDTLKEEDKDFLEVMTENSIKYSDNKFYLDIHVLNYINYEDKDIVEIKRKLDYLNIDIIKEDIIFDILEFNFYLLLNEQLILIAEDGDFEFIWKHLDDIWEKSSDEEVEPYKVDPEVYRKAVEQADIEFKKMNL
tara:strand:+ start:22 stop:969 length:948 start_codon:yes stop_codon:yes gene_type:complete